MQVPQVHNQMNPANSLLQKHRVKGRGLDPVSGLNVWSRVIGTVQKGTYMSTSSHLVHTPMNFVQFHLQ